MTDARLAQYSQFPLYFNIDLVLLSNGTLDQSQELATAVVVALGTNRLALASDLLPDPDSTDRQGWWGDLDAATIWNGWPIGSRLWLLKRSKITGSEASQGATVTLVEQYIREALQPFVELKIVSSFTVQAMRNGMERIDALIRMYRGPTLLVDLRYAVLWNEMQAEASINVPQQALTARMR
jgi:phage gp46-like protein